MTAAGIDVPEGEAKARGSARQRALGLALSSCTLWHTQENGPPQGFASFEKNGHIEDVELKATSGRQWLSGLVYKSTGEALSRQDLDGVMDCLEAAAIHEGPRMPVYVRLADFRDRIFLDLANTEWQIVEVTPRGWKVIPGNQAPVKFRRPNGTEALPHPEQGGTLEELADFVHTDKHGLVLSSAWLLGALTDRGPAPVLSLRGGQGTAKTTTTRILQSLVDPRGGALRSAPRKEKDLAIAARNAWIVSFDNLSSISTDFSDWLARLSTGSSFTTRMLYSNGDEAIFSARRPVILNSIVDVIGRPDLLQRSIMVQLHKISEKQRVPESIFWPRFEKAKPRILGALLSALADALGRWEESHPDEMPRMADFYHLACAAGESLPGGLSAFKNAWAFLERATVESALDSEPIGRPLLNLLEVRKKWKAPAGELLRLLNEFEILGARLHASWPKTPQGLVASLRRLIPALEASGWYVLLGVRDSSSKMHERHVVIVETQAIEQRIQALELGGMSSADAERQAALIAAS